MHMYIIYIVYAITLQTHAQNISVTIRKNFFRYFPCLLSDTGVYILSNVIRLNRIFFCFDLLGAESLIRYNISICAKICSFGAHPEVEDRISFLKNQPKFGKYWEKFDIKTKHDCFPHNPNILYIALRFFFINLYQVNSACMHMEHNIVLYFHRVFYCRTLPTELNIHKFNFFVS